MRHETRLAILLLAALAPATAGAQCTPGPHSGTISASQTWCLATVRTFWPAMSPWPPVPR